MSNYTFIACIVEKHKLLSTLQPANGHDTHMSHTTTIAIVTLCIEKVRQANRDGVKREETSQGWDWKHTS